MHKTLVLAVLCLLVAGSVLAEMPRGRSTSSIDLASEDEMAQLLGGKKDRTEFVLKCGLSAAGAILGCTAGWAGGFLGALACSAGIHATVFSCF
jgi:hypothetical protein